LLTLAKACRMRNAAKRCMFHVEHANLRIIGVFHVEQIVVRLGYQCDLSHFKAQNGQKYSRYIAHLAAT